MGAERDGAVASRMSWEEVEFTHDDCGICACEPDGRSRSWSNSDCPGEPGDILEFDRVTYRHYAVKVDGEHVVHLTGDGPVKWNNIASSASKNAVIKKEPFSKVARGSFKFRVYNKYDQRYRPYPADKIVKRALSNTSRRGYHMLFMNCEHFSNWCRYGVSMSHQVEMLCTTLVAVAGGVSLGLIGGVAGVVLGAAGGVALAMGSAVVRRKSEHQRAQLLKRSVSTAQMPSSVLSRRSLRRSVSSQQHQQQLQEDEQHQTADVVRMNGGAH